MSEEWDAAVRVLTTATGLPDRIRLERAAGTGPGRYAVEGHIMTSTGRGAAALPLVVRAERASVSSVSSVSSAPLHAMSPQAVACCRRCMP